jgi:hypothetical protein
MFERKLIAVGSALAVLVFATCVGTTQAAVSFGNFEDNTVDGFGALTNSGVQPWASPVAGAVITPGTGPLSGGGNKVLELTGNASFNFGQANGGALGFDFLAANFRADFLANSQIEFDWEPVPNGGSSGFSQLYNVILNSQGGGFTNVDGYGGGNANMNQFYFTGYTGNLHHIVVDYTNYKNTILASGFPNGGTYLQLGIQPNAGGGAPADMYFDNFQLTSPVPEPASLTLLALGTFGSVLRRRRH